MQILSIYINVWRTLANLVTSPDEQWRKINAENSRNELLNRFFYPFLFLSLLLIFVSKFLVFQEVNIIKSIFEIIFTAISFWGGFWVCKKICQYTTERFYQMQLSDIELNKIIVYSFAVILAVKTSVNLLHFSFFAIFSLYVVFVLWKACDEMLKVPVENREKFVITNSLSVIFVPFIIEYVLGKFF